MSLRQVSIAVVTALFFISAVSAQKTGDTAAQNLTVIDFSWKPFKPDDSAVAMPQFPHQDYAVIGSAPPRPKYQRTGPNNEWRVQKDREPDTPKRVEKEPSEKPVFDAALTLRNDDVKAIRSFEADFVFVDERGKEFLRYRFADSKKLLPGQQATFKRSITGFKRKEYSAELDWDILSELRQPKTKISIEVVSIVFVDGSRFVAN